MEQQTQQVRDVARGALDEAKQRVDAAAGTMVQEGKVLASALRTAADQAERDGARLLHGPLRSAAAAFERWADQTQSEGPRHLLTKLDAFGRREPLAFFGVAAAFGFLGTRALRAGAQAMSASAQMPMASVQQPAMPPPPPIGALDYGALDTTKEKL